MAKKIEDHYHELEQHESKTNCSVCNNVLSKKEQNQVRPYKYCKSCIKELKIDEDWLYLKKIPKKKDPYYKYNWQYNWEQWEGESLPYNYGREDETPDRYGFTWRYDYWV